MTSDTAQGMRMRASSLVVLAAVGVAGSGGCQEQKTVVVEQASATNLAANGVSLAGPARPPAPAQSPCRPPWGSGPFERTPRPLHGGSAPKSARAIAEHVSGCGGVRFRIGPDGTPRDIEVLADYPIGYGFGETVRAAAAASTWPPRDDLAWHYVDITMLARPR